MSRRFCIHAPTICAGGGSVLLTAFLQALQMDTIGFITYHQHFILPEDLPKNLIAQPCQPTLIGRLRAENYIKKNCQLNDVLLCFGNLPPLWSNAAEVVVFIQDVFLTTSLSTKGHPWRARVRIAILRLWSRLFLYHASRLIVQTPTVANNLRNYYKKLPPISSCAFVPSALLTPPPKSHNMTKTYDYVYIASGDPHKNHHNLLLAWVELAQGGFRPSLALTINHDTDPALCDLISTARCQHALKISLLGKIPHQAALDLYTHSTAMIFPSLAESFGLPLIEAQTYGLPILASDYDFVHALVNPSATFDPRSPTSIAKSIIQFEQSKRPPASKSSLTLCTASKFLALAAGYSEGSSERSSPEISNG
jgi:glycosyltransferase involved in cell wall biosynthesis